MADEASNEDVSDELPDVPESAESAPAAESTEEQGATQTADVWGNFRSMPEFQGANDEQIASRLYEAMQREQVATRALQQYQTIIPAASEYLSNREMFEQWKRSQANSVAPQNMPQQAPQPEEQPWWNPPKVRESYKQYLVRDQQGREMIAEEAPLEARHELSEYQAYRANFAKTFLENPEAALGPMVEKIVADRAQSIAQSKIDELKEQEFVTRIEQENSDWLYDQNGNAAPAGLLVQKYIEDAKRLGIRGAENLWNYAYRLVERDALARKYGQEVQQQPQAPVAPQASAPQPTTAPATNAEKAMQFIRHQAERKATARSGTGSTDARTPTKKMTFADRFRAQMKEEGLSLS